jgi:hypothetical protein
MGSARGTVCIQTPALHKKIDELETLGLSRVRKLGSVLTAATLNQTA